MGSPIFKPQDCPHPSREGIHEEYGRPDRSSFCRACGAEIDPPVFGWIVGNSDKTKWRTWECGYPQWTADLDAATRYHRRQDAEAVHSEDDGAWSVVPFAE